MNILACLCVPVLRFILTVHGLHHLHPLNKIVVPDKEKREEFPGSFTNYLYFSFSVCPDTRN